MGIEDDDRGAGFGPAVAEARDAMPAQGLAWPGARATAVPRPARFPKGPTALHAYLALPASQEHIRAVVRARVSPRTPEGVVDEMAQEANLAALEAKWPPRSTATARGWMAVVTLRTVQTHFRRSEVRRRYIRDDVDVDEQPAAPDGADASPDRWLTEDWLAMLLAESPRDAETFELLAYKVQTGESHDAVAAAHGMTPAAWKSRVHEFRAKYAPERQRRQAMFMLWLVAAGVALAVAVAMAWLLERSTPVLAPTVVPPLPSPSVAPPEPEPEPIEPFRQALPPDPHVEDKPHPGR